jgi:hypothetical protein
MQKVLDAVVEGPDWGKYQGNTMLRLVELNPGVGNMLDAFMVRRAALRMPMHYIGLADTGRPPGLVEADEGATAEGEA